MKRSDSKRDISLTISAAALACLILFTIIYSSVYFLNPPQSESQIPEDYVPAFDFNGNGISDAEDIVLGARKDAENHPTYDGSYQPGGYPPDNIGVCTDVIWRAFRAAGYSLRDMIDADIAARPDAYPNIDVPDSNIDFRRVKNLRVFFDTYAISLTTNIARTNAWQLGDIVIFGNDTHIGIVSDKRTESGRPLLIHNGGQDEREEDALGNDRVTGHYRFDASKLPKELRIAWAE